MRSILVLSIALFLSAAVHAQSGRRVQSAKTATNQPQVAQPRVTDGGFSDEPTIGYSESAPSRSIPLTRRNRSTRKEEKKAQETKPTQSADTAKAVEGEDQDVIKVDTNLVSIPVSVSDRDGFYVSNLREANFKIFEDGLEQKIEYFGTTDKPFTVVLLIDVSPSTSYKIEEIQTAAAAFVQQLLPHDQVMVIEFDSSVHVLAEVTGDRDKIFKAIRQTGFGDGTSLYQAVDFSLRKRLDKIEGRKAIVLFTDGVDTTSSGASYASTLEDAEESEAVIFPIYYNTFLQNMGIGGGNGPMTSTPTLGLPGSLGGARARQQASAEYARGRTYLTELAGVTGGKVFRPESTPGGLTAAFESIAEELRRQYVIGYYSGGPGSPGDRKGIRVRVDRPKLVVRARDSYVVGSK